MVGFNFYSPDQIEAVLAVTTIAFIMGIMVFSGAALSSVVTALAVAPLESMLDTVRQIAKTVFKFTAASQENEEEEETYDIDSSSEMKLLERVVQKLAIIADLQMNAADKVDTANMEEEDIGVLNMMEGQNLLERKAKQDRRSMAPVRKKAAVATIKVDDFGVAQDVYNSYAFNTMALSKPQKIGLATFTILHFHENGEGYVSGPEEEQRLSRFTNAVEAQYLQNPFHNFSHAVDVLHYTAKLMRSMNSEAFLTDLEQFALLIAAVGHDIGHPGVNNAFLAEVGHDLALQYNDRAPLENMHCSKLYSVMQVPETNVFASFKNEQYREARHCIIESILHTDMMVHQAMVKDLQMCFEMNSEVFEGRTDPNRQNVAQLAETELFNKDENKLMALECILHSADVSNPCRTWEISQAWAWCVLDEFFAQGDQEKMLGVPVQFLNDRDKLNKPNSQIGFLEFMIAPFYVAQIKLWPSLFELGDNLGGNITNWEDMWVKEVSPDEESKAKVRARVAKVVANLDEAKACGQPKES
jgi:cAMP-specific phosphodiesterase 4